MPMTPEEATKRTVEFENRQFEFALEQVFHDIDTDLSDSYNTGQPSCSVIRYLPEKYRTAVFDKAKEIYLSYGWILTFSQYEGVRRPLVDASYRAHLKPLDKKETAAASTGPYR